MRRRSKTQLNSEAVETLLIGGTAGFPDLERLLDEASHPTVSLQTSAQRALASFQQAMTEPHPQSRRWTKMKSVLAAAVSSKVLAGVAVAAAATSGIAIAATASSNHAPNPAAAAGSANAPASAHATASADPTTTGSATDHPTATPSPNLSGLCTAYAAGATHNPGKAANSPAFKALITAAGGANNVTTYCASLPASAPTGQPTDLPGGKPSSIPTGEPSGLPTGKPAGVPTPPAHP